MADKKTPSKRSTATKMRDLRLKADAARHVTGGKPNVTVKLGGVEGESMTKGHEKE